MKHKLTAVAVGLLLLAAILATASSGDRDDPGAHEHPWLPNTVASGPEAQTLRTGNGDITVHLNGGLDEAYVGDTNIIEVYIANDAMLTGMSFAFEFSIGRNFAFDPVHGGSGHYVKEWNDAVGAWDDLTGLIENQTAMNDTDPDSILVGGACMSQGLPANTSRLCYTMAVFIPAGQSGLPNGFCIDNIFFPPAGTWTFVDAAGSYAPTYQGNPNSSQSVPDAPPVCFDIVGPLDSALTLDTVIGLNSSGQLIADAPLEFVMRWTYTTGSPILGFTNGFQVYSPDGATWQPISLDTFSLGWPTMFDGGFFEYYFSATGSGTDTAAYGAFAIFGPGVTPPFDTPVWWIETQVSSVDIGKHLCVDSSFFPPAGIWIWASQPSSFPPYWDGPHCFEIGEPEPIWWKEPEGVYMPDFDQNQDAWQNYCGPTATANCLWWFDSLYPGWGLVPDGTTPPELIDSLALLMSTNVAPPNGTHVDSLQSGIDQWLALHNCTQHLAETTVYMPDFDYCRDQLMDCQDVILLLGFWECYQIVPDQPEPGCYTLYWERWGGHFVTMAGVDSAGYQVGFSDPDKDAALNGNLPVPPSRVLGPNHGYPEAHNDGISVSHDVYNVSTLGISPGGLWEIPDYYYISGFTSVDDYTSGTNPNPQKADRQVTIWCGPLPGWVHPGAVVTETEAAVVVCPKPPVRDTVKCEPQGGQNPSHPPHYWYDVTPTDFGRCNFHVEVFDSIAGNYSNWQEPTGWTHAVHKVGGKWWVSWWNPGCTNAIFDSTRFGFDNDNPSDWGGWRTTIDGTDDPYAQVIDSSENHNTEPDGYGYRVHVPMPAEVRDTVVCEPQGGNNPTHPPTYWYDVTPGDFGRCDFHVKVQDEMYSHYRNFVEPAGWVHTVHRVGTDWWVSWWNPGCTNAIFSTTRFSFDNQSDAAWDDWRTTIGGTDHPFAAIIDSSANHTGDPDGYGYRVHVPYFEEPPHADSSISLDDVHGLYGPGQIVAGDTIRFFLRMTYLTGTPIDGMSNGYQVYSPDGATWQPIVFDTIPIAWPSMFDLGIFLTYASNTGSGADSVLFGAVRMMQSGMVAPFDEQSYWIETMVSTSEARKHLCLDSAFVPPSGSWLWASNIGGSFPPKWDGPHCFEIMAPCIPPLRGNVDYDPGDATNIVDLTFLVNYLFGGGAPPPSEAEADVNADGAVNIVDVTYLVAYLFGGGPAPLPCP